MTSATIDASVVKDLHKRTGAGIMDCKKALVEVNGNVDAAIDLLRKRGAAVAAKKADRVASEGTVQSYIHMGGRVGVLIQLCCETDFVAKNDQFKQLAKDLCMQIAAMSPLYIRREEVPAELVEKEKELLADSVKGKPATAAESIIKGKLDKFYAQVCLLEQSYIKDNAKTIQDIVTDAINRLGENIVVAKFERYQIGG